MRYAIKRPELVQRALRLAEELSFDVRPEGNSGVSGTSKPSSCIDEMGALLRTLTASVDGGLIGEIGTGVGVGTGWLAAGLRPGVRLLTVEIDPRLAAGVRSQIGDQPNIQVLTGDWRGEFNAMGPFDLLFADGGGVGNLPPGEWNLLAGLVKPGGILTMDDLTPEEFWPASWKDLSDPKRELAFRSGFFVAAEIRLRTDISALVMTRK